MFETILNGEFYHIISPFKSQPYFSLFLNYFFVYIICIFTYLLYMIPYTNFSNLIR